MPSDFPKDSKDKRCVFLLTLESLRDTVEMMLVAVRVMWGGVYARFPTVRIGFLESDGGWVAPGLDRMDRHCDD